MELDTYFTQRKTLLASSAANRMMLCYLDRQLTLAVTPDELPALLAPYSLPDKIILLQALNADVQHQALQTLQQQLALEQQWYIASLFPLVPVPEVLPEALPLALRAYRINPERAGILPEPWQEWWSLLQADQPRPAVSQLLDFYAADPAHAHSTIFPLLLRMSPDQIVRFINELSKRITAAALIPWLGLSLLGHFVPWLKTIAQTAELQEAAQYEIQWLTGGIHPAPIFGRQIWGAEATPQRVLQLQQHLPMQWQPRLWYWLQPGSTGDYWTRNGGMLCLDN